MQGGGAPPPPPHGTKPNTTDGQYAKGSSLPSGNYDIFIVPPHSSGSGFLYLPSLQCHWSSFIAGCVSTLVFTLFWSIISPFLKAWCSSAAASGNGLGIVVIALVVAVAGWAIGILQTYLTTGALPSFPSFDGFGDGGSGGSGRGRGANRGRGRHSRGKSYSRYRSSRFPDDSSPGDTDDSGSRERKRQRGEREKEARERDDAEARAKSHRDAVEAKLKEMRATAAARAQSQKEASEAKMKAEKEAATRAAARKEADAKFAALKEAAAKKYAERKAREGETNKNDRPRRPYAGTYASSVYSESSYAPSHSTARTSPPPTFRGAYTTNDPDKIVIKAVFAFNNAYVQTPLAQLVSGRGMVTDGLVLRMTTEGLFIDDDVRGIPQREWDIKAWTMKLVEVWCPHTMETAAGRQSPSKRRATGLPTAEESEACVNNLAKICLNRCRTGDGRGDGATSSPEQNLHVVRASLRDQEGKKYVFILQESEGWKVSIGLQRLRGGSQVRALGVSNISVTDCKALLGKLSY